VSAGRERFHNADLRVVTPGPLKFSDQEFDTVIFKDSLHHVAAESDVDAALAEVARVCSRRIVIFEPNPSVPLKIGRTLIGHVDPTLSPESARSLLRHTPFEIVSLEYLASLAFPLSGGYVGRPLLPRWTSERIFRLDDQIIRVLGSRVAWRYLMVADRGRNTSTST
jgi:ubiquinone/menaquinone biosynthesis C-methylase UbiE